MDSKSALDLALTYFVNTSVTTSSVKQYRANLARWFRMTGATDAVMILSNPKKYLVVADEAYRSGEISHSTKKLLIATICSLYKHYPEYEEQYKHARTLWSTALKQCNKMQFEAAAHLEPTKKQADNWVTWSEVERYERFLDSTEYGSDRHLILAMYVLIEPARADYGNIAIAIDKKRAKALNKSKRNFVYLSSSSNKSYMVLNNYKTIKTYGRFYRSLPDQLVRIIAHNLEKNPRAFLFANRQNEEYPSREAFRIRLNRDLANMFQKSVTVMILRHSFISSLDFNTLTPARLFEISRNMMHSIGTQQLYRRSVVQPTYHVALSEADTQHTVPPVTPSSSAPPPPPQAAPATSSLPQAVTASYVFDTSPHRPSSHRTPEERAARMERRKRRKKKSIVITQSMPVTAPPIPRFGGRVVTI
jgi:hypothetical protein